MAKLGKNGKNGAQPLNNMKLMNGDAILKMHILTLHYKHY